MIGRCLFAGVMAVLLAACVPATDVPTATAAFVPATIPASATPTPVPADEQPVPPPTVQPIAGTTTTQLNVRQEPMGSSTVLGTIPASSNVEILARDPGSKWYQIAFAGASNGLGWVASQYVSVAEEGRVPVVEAGKGRVLATLRERIHVRGGPGTDFESLGTLSAADAVWLTGKDESGAWLQVEYSSAPQGKAWAAGSFFEVDSIDGLPIVAEGGEVLGTSTPTGAPPLATPTIGVAAPDTDSEGAPAVQVRFAPSGTGALLYSGEVSAPDGDGDDWIAFTPYEPWIRIEVECEGNGSLLVLVLHGDGMRATDEAITCGSIARIELSGVGSAHLMHVSIRPTQGGAAYVRYVVSIDNNP